MTPHSIDLHVQPRRLLGGEVSLPKSVQGIKRTALDPKFTASVALCNSLQKRAGWVGLALMRCKVKTALMFLVILWLLPSLFVPAQPPFHVPTLPRSFAEMAVPQIHIRDLHCLAETIYMEARGEPYDGQRMVGEVVLNRLEAGFAKTVCGVVYQHGQFQWTKRHFSIKDRAAYAHCRDLAFRLLAGYEPRSSQKFLYFFATWLKKRPIWAASMHQQLQISNHLFLS